MKTTFRVDASTQIGTGHLARCLTLADFLRRFGMETHFICRAPAPLLAAQITSQGHSLAVLPPLTASFDHAVSDLAHASWLGVPQEQDAEESLSVLDGGTDMLVVDHYGIDYRWQRRVRDASDTVLVIDDLADRTHDCDFLLDQNLVGGRARYQGLVPDHCEMLVGPSYALLRPEFAAPPICERHAGHRLNIFLGGTDPHGGTLLALEAVAPLCAEALAVDVVVGGATPHLSAIRAASAALRCVTLHVQTNDMAKLFVAADLGIGAGGSATLERCNRGLPQILTSFADNQRPACQAFAQAGVALDVGDMNRLSTADLREAVVSLLANREQLAAMGERGRHLVDGKGTQRVAASLKQAARIRA
jgi:UDP-2,4-diacetamido-2,4,6-trideoxy-beta-L-altropyranose hydrolase